MATSLRNVLGPDSYSALQSGSRPERLSALKNLSADDARKVLISIACGLESRKGILRLLHVGSDTKDMRFDDVGKFKAWFLDRGKHIDSGAVLSALMEKAGVRDHDKFAAYAQSRGKWGVEKKILLGYVKTLQVHTAETASACLERSGVNYEQKDGYIKPPLGQGGQGEAYAGTFRGQPCVIKDYKESKHSALVLAEMDGTLIKPAVKEYMRRSESQRSYQTLHSSESEHKKGEGSALLKKPGQVKNPYMNSREPSEEDYRVDDKKNSFEPSKHSVNKRFGTESQTALQARADEARDDSHDSPLSRVRSHEESDFGEDGQKDGHDGGPQPVLIGGSKNSMPPAVPHKLGRSNAIQAVNVKSNPHVVAPALYVIKEQRVNRDVIYHAVDASNLKRWAQMQDRQSDFSLSNTVMPVAEGKRLDKASLTREQLPRVAAEFMKALQQFARQGFIHGDIKEDNAFFGSKGLQVIDEIGFKVSKNPDSPNALIPAKAGLSTDGYRHPFIDSRLACGVGRDLFAVGSTLLRLGLDADPSLESIAGTWRLRLGGGNTSASARDRFVKNLERDFAEQGLGGRYPELRFAARCMIEAIRYEEARLAQGTNNHFERWRPESAEHILNQLASDPFVSKAMTT